MKLGKYDVKPSSIEDTGINHRQATYNTGGETIKREHFVGSFKGHSKKMRGLMKRISHV